MWANSFRFSSAAFVFSLRRDGEVWKVQNIGKQSANEPIKSSAPGQP